VDTDKRRKKPIQPKRYRMKFGLEQHIIDKLIAVFEQHSKVDKALVFGSRAKGNYRPDSDIDIAIKGQDLNTDDIIAMSVAFEEKGIYHKIDLINYHTIKESDLKDHIDRVGIELYSGWRELKLGQIVELNRKTIDKTYKYNEIEYLDTGSITQNKIEGFQSLKLKDAPSRAKRLVQKNDIIYSTVRPIHRHYGFIENANEKMVVSTGFAVVSTIKEKADAKFLYYLLSTNDVVNFLDSIADGSTSAYPSLRPDDLAVLDILLPPLSEQTAIASILSSLDDKIDLLHRQNKTLEQLAETLFRQWFVEEAEESWEETSLSEIADHSKENIHPSKNPTKLYKHYSLPAFDSGKEPIIEIGKEILSNKYKVISNSILVSKLNPRTPRIWMIYGNVNEDESICSTEFQIVKPKDHKWYGFIYCFLKSYNVTQELAGSSSGTSGSHQRVNPQDIFNLTFFKPTDILVEKFSKVMDNYLVKINNNQTQIRTLTKTRNTLLPKLITGEVRTKI